MRHPVGDGWVDCVLRNVPFDSDVVVVSLFVRQPAALAAHLVGGLPSAGDHLADAPHRLRIGPHDADGAQVVEDILGGDGFAPDATFGESYVLGQVLVQMVADHQHVEVLVECVDGIGPRRIRRAG